MGVSRHAKKPEARSQQRCRSLLISIDERSSVRFNCLLIALNSNINSKHDKDVHKIIKSKIVSKQIQFTYMPRSEEVRPRRRALGGNVEVSPHNVEMIRPRPGQEGWR